MLVSNSLYSQEVGVPSPRPSSKSTPSEKFPSQNFHSLLWFLQPISPDYRSRTGGISVKTSLDQQPRPSQVHILGYLRDLSSYQLEGSFLAINSKNIWLSEWLRWMTKEFQVVPAPTPQCLLCFPFLSWTRFCFLATTEKIVQCKLYLLLGALATHHGLWKMKSFRKISIVRKVKRMSLPNFPLI